MSPLTVLGVVLRIEPCLSGSRRRLFHQAEGIANRVGVGNAGFVLFHAAFGMHGHIFLIGQREGNALDLAVTELLQQRLVHGQTHATRVHAHTEHDWTPAIGSARKQGFRFAGLRRRRHLGQFNYASRDGYIPQLLNHPNDRKVFVAGNVPAGVKIFITPVIQFGDAGA